MEAHSKESEGCFVTGGVERLPDEVLLGVFEYLTVRDVLAASHVCRRWNRLATHRTLIVRRSRDARHAHQTLRQLFVVSQRAKLPMIITNTPWLHTLIVHERVPLDEATLTALQELRFLSHLDIFLKPYWMSYLLFPILQRLQTLVINNMSMGPSVLREMTATSRLTQLHMYGRSQYYPPRTMTALLESRRLHLTELTLRCTELPDFAYQVIGRCPNLVVLRLYACWLLRAHSQGAMTFTCPPKLRVLHLTGARMLRKTPLNEFIETLPDGLEELSLSGTCFGVEHTKTLVDRVPNLRELELWNTPAPIDALFNLAMNLLKLRELDVDKIFAENELKELAGHPSLVSLRCLRPLNLSEDKFHEVAGRLAPVATPDARYGRKTLRPDGDGWRSSLFYHWSVGHPLRPLPSDTPPPAFDNDFEDDFSLLGPEFESTCGYGIEFLEVLGYRDTKRK